MIRVCDAIMGSGKSSAAINYINDHKEDKFIYISPYLDEAHRIKVSCPDLHFVEPSNKLEQYHFSKRLHTMDLIKEGRSVATTHQAFHGYTKETLELVKRYNYTLIVDESLGVLEEFDFSGEDLQIAVDAGRVNKDESSYTLNKSGYEGKMYKEMFDMMGSHRLQSVDCDNIISNNLYPNDKHLLFWVMPRELLDAFQNVFILTYLFKGQELYYFFQINKIPYENIGVKKDASGGYRFCDEAGATPEYLENIGEKLEILDNKAMNSIGDSYYALSHSWYKRKKGVDKMKKNLYNFFKNICRGVPARQKLWATFNDAKSSVQGQGYTKAFLQWNARATNAYRECTCLAYPINVFMHTRSVIFYEKFGVHVDQDAYALSTMLQWIWRSEIRDGEKILLYIPSRRMRTLLINWMNSITAKGNEVND